MMGRYSLEGFFLGWSLGLLGGGGFCLGGWNGIHLRGVGGLGWG